MKSKAKILVVDDNDGIRAALKILLMRHFAEVELIASPKELRSVVMRFKPDVVLLDMNFYTDMNTGNEGLFCLSEIKRYAPQIEVVLFTAYADIQLAVEGMKRGAFDFVVKPWDNDRLVEILKSAYNRRKKETKPQAKSAITSQMYWGEGEAMQMIRKKIDRFAPTDATILITGENGTGKDVLANEIHRLSDRAMQPMVCVDAGAITETLFESELFGHVKGAFTDAHADRIGKMEAANGSTLFMDEIGNMPLHHQAKLLTALQNRNITRLGTNEPIDIDIRLITATNRNLSEMADNNDFRQDLLFRINTIHINIPPLRNRKEDIVPLALMFLKKYSEKYKKENLTFSKSSEERLTEHRWDGNIRELQHTVEKAVIMCDDNIVTPEHLGLFLSTNVASSNKDITLEEMERNIIAETIKSCDGNLTIVAQKLGVTRQTLYNKIKRHNL